MKSLIIGTAGHIDHGKTSIVRSITGVDTDRLKEEKERGITIDLGFASCIVNNDNTKTELSFVDVPGHEKLIRTMIAGAYAIDAVLLVISSLEGVMQQTIEHLQILSLLGIKQGIIALNKIDKADDDIVSMAEEEIRDAVKGSFLEGVTIIKCSAQTREGIDDLVYALSLLEKKNNNNNSEEFFRLPIDRSFGLKGFGTVVTGTITSGKVEIGSSLQLLPMGKSFRVRGIQVHGKEREYATALERVALNISNLEKESVFRGCQLVTPYSITLSAIADFSYTHIASNILSKDVNALSTNTRVRIITTTQEESGVVHIISKEQCSNGESVFIQVHFDKAIALVHGDRYILRRESPMETLGGGVVLDPTARKYKKKEKEFKLEILSILKNKNICDKIEAVTTSSFKEGMSLDQISKKFFIPSAGIKKYLNFMRESSDYRVKLLDSTTPHIVSEEIFKQCKNNIIDSLTKLHNEKPLKAGFTKSEVFSKLSFFTAPIIEISFETLLEEKLISTRKTLFHLRNFNPRPNDSESIIVNKIISAFDKADLATPFLQELTEYLDCNETTVVECLSYMIDQGFCIKIKEGYWVNSTAIKKLENDIRKYFETKETMSPVEFKELTSLSRKWSIPLLEYLDKVNITARQGDVRIIKNKKN